MKFGTPFFSIQGLSEFLNISSLQECNDSSSANNTYQEFYRKMFYGNKEDWLQRCPLPCMQTVYDIGLQRYHKYNVPFAIVDNSGKPGVLLSLKYENLATEEQVETLIYDASNFLAQVGGSLGLFLGFSCLSLLIGIINFFEKILQV